MFLFKMRCHFGPVAVDQAFPECSGGPIAGVEGCRFRRVSASFSREPSEGESLGQVLVKDIWLQGSPVETLLASDVGVCCRW